MQVSQDTTGTSQLKFEDLKTSKKAPYSQTHPIEKKIKREEMKEDMKRRESDVVVSIFGMREIPYL